MGIANAVSIARSNVPRAIASLKDDGLLIERQAHVTGVARKRKAYFLTDDGLRVAEDTHQDLAVRPLRAILPEGKTINATFGESPDVLPFPMRPVDIIRYLDESGLLDLRNLNSDLIERDLSKNIEKQLVTVTGDLPRVRAFYGRDRELENMVSLLEARPTCLLVPGIAGIGKTTLAAKMIEAFTHRRNLLYHRCQDWEGPRAFLDSVGDWLVEIGDPALSDYLAATAVPRPDEVVRILCGAFAEIPCLIVIDDYHKVADDVLHNIIRGLVLALPSTSDIGLVVFSRSFREVLPIRDAVGTLLTLVFPLDGLDPDASRCMLTSLDEIDDVQFLQIYGITRGHPLALELVNRGASSATFHGTLETYVEAEILSRLEAAQKRVLSALGVFREAVPVDSLPDEPGLADILDELVDRGLARESDDGVYDVHDLVREFVLRSIEPRVRRDLHMQAAKWYHGHRNSLPDTLEYLHHLSLSGDHDEVALEIIESGQALVRAGQMELVEIILGLDESVIQPRSWCEVKLIHGDLLTLQGEWDHAEEAYSSVVGLAESLGKRALLARLQSSLADLMLHRGRTSEALSLHLDALEAFIMQKDAVGSVRTYNNIGAIQRRNQNRKAALEAYEKAEMVLLDEDPNDLLTGARLTLARAFIEIDELDRARDHAMIAFEQANGIDDALMIARAQATLGRYYARTDESDLALHHYSQALDRLGDLGDPRSAVEVSLLLGDVLVETNRSDEALERYREALAMAEANDYRMLIGEILTRLGDAATDRQRQAEYLNRALNVFRELGAKSRMQEVQMQVHRALTGRDFRTRAETN